MFEIQLFFCFFIFYLILSSDQVERSWQSETVLNFISDSINRILSPLFVAFRLQFDFKYRIGCVCTRNDKSSRIGRAIIHKFNPRNCM